MENNKGKPVTTSVPSISIKFHANAEELEEFYHSDEESTNKSDKTNLSSTAPPGSGEPDSSPLKYFPKLVKRSTSIDVSAASLDSSPPSDPWRFFSDIKGKITKSVEEKITEIKQRNSEESSPSRTKPVKDSKESSSVSDSEDISESSISKTCGVVSTTEGVEMSSEEDTSFLLDKDKPESSNKTLEQPAKRRSIRFRAKDKNKTSKEGNINDKSVSNLVQINNSEPEPENNDEIESAVDALEDSDLAGTNDELLKQLSSQYKNIEIDDDGSIVVDKLTGEEVRKDYFSVSSQESNQTIYSPTGFVDLRAYEEPSKYSIYIHLSLILAAILAYTILHRQSSYFAGMAMGIGLTLTYNFLKHPVCLKRTVPNQSKGVRIQRVSAADEFEPIAKYEGWMNEYPEEYDPNVYHISFTQTVYLRLQGNLLRISHTKSKIPKRATWNEPDLKPHFTYHRVYNLKGAKISLLPAGLNKKRHWSKKYPICVTLNPDMMNFDTFLDHDQKNNKEKNKHKEKKSDKKDKPIFSQRFSKLYEEDKLIEEQENESSRPSSPSFKGTITDRSPESEFETNDEDSLNTEDWSNCSIDESPTETRLYLFGRTGREKEDWFRKFAAATHTGAQLPQKSHNLASASISDTLLDGVRRNSSYLQFMMQFKQPVSTSEKVESKVTPTDEETCSSINKCLSGTDVLWLNAILGRILFDCMRDNRFSEMIRDKLWRKMTSVKLPYFIEELNIVELNMGSKPPFVNRIDKPYLDDRGLWIDLDLLYEGSIVCTIQTQLNLMKLKQEKIVPTKDKSKSAIFHSDVEDSAESSSDEEVAPVPSQVLDASGQPVKGLGGQSRTSKKLVRMVDKIAESKIFQAASENRYIKRAMEGVSNTDLRLSVTIKKLSGIFVLNIPPPPSDRIWIGFRPVPELIVSAQPIVGERNISFMKVTSWIEQKIITEFQKLLVLPNMDDLVIPVMSQDLPE